MQSQQQIINYLIITLSMTCRLTEGRCPKPTEPDVSGFLPPDITYYDENASVNYKCAPGRKTFTGGWWSTIICRQGKWSHTPQCIDEKDCFTPEVHNARINIVRTSYKQGDTVTFECSWRYRLKADNFATCLDGDWTTLPICDKIVCPAPPKMDKAVVVDLDYQPSFEEGTVLNYKCMESHEMNGATRSTCVNGEWTERGHCVPKPAPTRMPIATGDSGSRGRATGSAIGSGGVSGQDCPNPPQISNGDVISQVNNAATYQCANFYKLHGNKKISCRNGQWDTPPTCKPNFCKVSGKVLYLTELVVPKYINEGRYENFYCERWPNYQGGATGTCLNGRIHFRGCSEYDWVSFSATDEYALTKDMTQSLT
ncbi:complement factor H-related protein 1-like [Sardina pilchardus]|uniref:complement factor H-related protein 1-like n=1 Tax=Sardina pilchardus TaxID=27697 RepID=UPI002E0F88D2